MKKRFFIPVLLALLASLLGFSTVLAQTDDANIRPRGGRRGIGKITSIGSDQIIVLSRLGEERKIFVNGETRYRNYDGTKLEFSDLQVGDWVAGIIHHDPEQGLIARLVMVLPDDYDPSQRLGVRTRGHITTVDQDSSTFTLHSANGNQFKFSVSDNTVFKGAVDSFGDLQVGMLAGVAGMKQDDGSLLAHVIVARYEFVRTAGKVVSVDLDTKSFTLVNRRGDYVSILVDENTKFRSKDGESEDLDDLLSGMVAIVSAKKLPDRGFVALFVAVGAEDQLSEFDLKVVGKIIAIDQRGFTLKAHNGYYFTLQINEATRFRSRGNRIHGLQDLKVGMVVMVGAQERDSVYIAKVVVVGKPTRP